MKKVPSGIPGFDQLLAGGIYERSSTVIGGPPGAGKTTFGLHFLYGGATRYGEPGIFITFEEFPETIYRDALNLGWDLKKEEEAGRLKVIFTSPSVLKSELEREGGLFDQLVASIDARRVVIDSVTLMEQIAEGRLELRAIYNGLVNGFKRLGLTSILTAEVPWLFGDRTSLESGLGFLVDNILLLRFVEIESELETALTVLKVRGSAHAKDIRRYHVGAHGIEIETKFAGRQGILTGFPSRTVSAETLLQEGLIKKRR
ncbi:MAG: ATPase [Actinobacteria bacterium]|nr:ATPase [Actinomycetota bacterium]